MGLLYRLIVGNASEKEALEKVKGISPAELIEKIDSYLILSEEDADGEW